MSESEATMQVYWPGDTFEGMGSMKPSPYDGSPVTPGTYLTATEETDDFNVGDVVLTFETEGAVCVVTKNNDKRPVGEFLTGPVKLSYIVDDTEPDEPNADDGSSVGGDQTAPVPGKSEVDPEGAESEPQSSGLKRYVCHKVVLAGKIVGVDRRNATSSGSVILEGNTRVLVPAAFLDSTHTPPVNGHYYVQYEDGFQSVSPPDVFEKGYREISEEDYQRYLEERDEG